MISLLGPVKRSCGFAKRTFLVARSIIRPGKPPAGVTGRESRGLDEWDIAENNHGYNEDSRGLGLADLAYAVRDKRPPRASGEMAFHVFDIMLGILESSKTGAYSVLESTCTIPSPLLENFPRSER